MRVKVEFGNNLKQKFKDFHEEGQFVLDSEVLKSSNNYIPFDTGNLKSSSIANTILGSGMIVWNTPYARRLYYNPQYNFSHDVNPLANGLWFEHAKASDLQNWVDILDNLKKQKI